MTDASMAVYTEPTSGMNLVPLPANIIPLGPNGLMPTPMRASSLSRLAELQRFLLQCDEPSYFGNYFEVRPVPCNTPTAHIFSFPSISPALFSSFLAAPTLFSP